MNTNQLVHTLLALLIALYVLGMCMKILGLKKERGRIVAWCGRRARNLLVAAVRGAFRLASRGFRIVFR